MKSFIEYLSILAICILLAGCEKKINLEVDIIPHTRLLNLKGEVEQIHLFSRNYELTVDGYRKTDNNRFEFNILRSDVNFYLNLLSSDYELGLYSVKEGITSTLMCINPNYTALRELYKNSLVFKACSDIKISFNRQGYITNIIGYNNESQIFSHSLSYNDKNQLTQSVLTSYSNDRDVSFFLREGTTDYEYNEVGLVSQITLNSHEGTTPSYRMNFEYQSERDKILVTTQEQNYTNNSTDKYTAYILYDIDTHKLNNLYSDSLNIYIDYSNNGLAKHFVDNREEIDCTYNRYNLKDLIIKNASGNHTYTFEYNTQGDIEKCIVDNTPYLSMLCSYEYDSQDNWKKQSVSISNEWINSTMNSMQELERVKSDIELKKTFGLDYYDSYSQIQNLAETIASGKMGARKNIINRVLKYYE